MRTDVQLKASLEIGEPKADEHASVAVVDTPKVFLRDLKLPKIDGLDVLKRIKGGPRTKLIPVVVFISSRGRSDVLGSYELNSYIVRPVNFERLSDAVRNLALYWQSLDQSPKVADYLPPCRSR